MTSMIVRILNDTGHDEVAANRFGSCYRFRSPFIGMNATEE
jgi:hypothetical protein